MGEAESKDTIEAVFESAIEIENKAADIYRKFSQLFSHIQDVSDFWQGLTEDEMQHANTLQDIRKPLTSEQVLSPCDKDLSAKVAEIQLMQSEVLTRSIKNLDDAFELAHELEFSELNAIFKLLATEFVPSEERKQFLVSGVTKHQQKLKDFGHTFGDRDWRKAISVHTSAE